LKKKLILLTGLLIRLDHAASGGLEVEELPLTANRQSLLQNMLNQTFFAPSRQRFPVKKIVFVLLLIRVWENWLICLVG